ncbi:MAG: hypothetical protein GF409_02600 [Candidatus Omnitrophica bacterium]|nr:hypothetical protein [Candidatus Omnitrophota bacterium]
MDFTTFKKIIYREGYIIVSFFLMWFILNLLVTLHVKPTYSFHRTVDILVVALYAGYWFGRFVSWLIKKNRQIKPY